VFFLVPVGVLVVYSFFERGPYGGVVYDWTLDNYRRALDDLYIGVLLTSVRIAVVSTAVALLIGYPGRVLHREGRASAPGGAAGARDTAVLDELSSSARTRGSCC